MNFLEKRMEGAISSARTCNSSAPLVFGNPNDLTSESPVSSANHPIPRRRIGVMVALALSSGLLVALFLSNAGSRRPDPEFIWLTPSQFSRANSIGPFGALAYRLMYLTAPLWRGYWSRRPKVTISASVYELIPEAETQAGLPFPSSTNAGGERAWILSPAELTSLRHMVAMNLSPSLVNQAVIQTADGIHCTVTTGTSASRPTRLTFDALAKLGPGWVRLFMAASSTSTSQAQSSSSSVVHTNLAAACRVCIPNLGGVLLATPRGNSGTATNFWILISATAR